MADKKDRHWVSKTLCEPQEWLQVQALEDVQIEKVQLSGARQLARYQTSIGSQEKRCFDDFHPPQLPFQNRGIEAKTMIQVQVEKSNSNSNKKKVILSPNSPTACESMVVDDDSFVKSRNFVSLALVWSSKEKKAMESPARNLNGAAALSLCSFLSLWWWRIHPLLLGPWDVRRRHQADEKKHDSLVSRCC